MTVARIRGIASSTTDTRDARLIPVGGGRRPAFSSIPTVLLLIFAIAPASRIGHAEPPTVDLAGPDEARLREVVGRLASPEFQGRSGAGGRKAADFLVEEFRRLRLEPMTPGGYIQQIPPKEPGDALQGRNVGGILRGLDPKLKDEWIVLGTHFDHLGVRDGVLYPGADDNASGVAMMLEVARSLTSHKSKPLRSVLFLGFDLEEIGLFGSRYFVAHPTIPLDRISLFLTADMIGRSLAGVCEEDVFVFGTEHSPAVRPWILEAAAGKPLSVGLLGADLLVLNRSDYGPFRSRNVPFLFFTTGENPRYHSPRDDAASLNYPKLTAISRLIDQVVRRAASAPESPKWISTPDNPLQEAVAIRKVLRQLLENQERLKIGTTQLFLMKNTVRSLDEIIARDTITPAERARIIQAARIILFTVI